MVVKFFTNKYMRNIHCYIGQRCIQVGMLPCTRTASPNNRSGEAHHVDVDVQLQLQDENLIKIKKK